MLTGGPGQAATERVVAFAQEAARTRLRRDIVLVDQRGSLLAACAGDAKCQSAFPQAGEEFQRVLDTLARSPVHVTLKPEQGTAQTVRISRERFAQLVHLMLFIPPLSQRLPFLIHQASEGRFEEFAGLAVAFEAAIAAQIYWGLQLAVVCPEDLARITPEDVAQQTPGTFLGDMLIRSYKTTCSEWPLVPLPEDYWQLVTISVPALLLSGDRDPLTPPRFGEEVARHLPLSRHIVMPGATHIHASACVDRVVADFIAAGSAEAVDTACLQAPRPWGFFIPEGTVTR